MEHITQLLSLYGYLLLLPLAIIEGPIVTVIGGFFVRIGILNPFIVYIIVIAGDIIGDALFYAIGRYGKNTFLHWIGRHIGIHEGHIAKVRDHFDRHAWKTLMAAKLVQGVGPVGLIAAGGARMPYLRFMFLCLSVSLIQSAAFLAVGFLFGHAYVELNRSLHYFASGAIVLAILSGLLYLLLRHNGERI